MNQLLQTGVLPGQAPSPHAAASPMSGSGSFGSRQGSLSPDQLMTSLSPEQRMTSRFPARAGPAYCHVTPPHTSPSQSREATMAYSPYSVGSNSTSPPSQTSPLPYVKTEQHPRHGVHAGPRLVIVEQPQERFRFRYESELGGTHGQLAGRSGAERRSFPTVKLEGFHGKANIKCELYTVSDSGKPPVPHVHTLQGRYCANGVADFSIDHSNDYTASFQGLGIIHTAKKAMLEKIKARKLMEKNTGPHWKPTEAEERQATQEANSESLEINMNRVCLRFRALVQDPASYRMRDICEPVYSDPIFNGKSAQTGELKIVQLSDAYSPCTGNKEIWLLVERVRKNDIKVRFFEEDETKQEIWHAYGKVSKCHHQYAIIFQTPAYHNKDLRGSVRVFIQLERPSDGCVSEAKHFQYTERDQRATKRLGIQAEATDQKRCRTVEEPTGGSFQFCMPESAEFRGLLRDLKEDPGYAELLLTAQQQQQPQQQYLPPQLHQQQLQQQQQQQLSPVPPQHYYDLPPNTASYATVTSYPMACTSQSVTMSPPMAQQPVYRPLHQPQTSPHMSQMMLPTRDPTLSQGPATVDDIMGGNIPLTVPQMPSGPRAPGPGLNTTGGQVSFGAPPFLPPRQEPDLSVMHSVPVTQAMEHTHTIGDDELSNLLASYGSVLEDGVPTNQPDPKECAPRGVRVRGLGSRGQGGATSAEDGAAALAQSLGQLSLRQGQGEPPEQPRQSPAAAQNQTIDLSRPEVKLAYADAERLYLFAATGDQRCLLENSRFLVGMQNSDGDNPLHVAALYRRPQSMAGFIQAISGMAAESREERINGQNGARQTPLHIAVLTGNLECISLLLDAGAHCHLVDCGGNTVVHLAARTGEISVLQYVLQRLQQEGSLRRLLQLTNYQGFTALHVAVKACRPEAVQQLISAGADPSATCDTEGRSPLHLAVEAENLELCQLLLSLGAEVDAPTFGDVTPLHVACKLGSCRVVALLLSAGADPYRRSVERQVVAGSGTESGEEDDDEQPEYEGDDQRLDAFLYAELSGNSQLEQLLRRRGRLSPEGVAPPAVAMPTRATAAAAPAAVTVASAVAAPLPVAAGKKGGDGLDSGMDSGLGITQELTSEMTSSSEGSAAEVLPDAVARRLASLLDAGPWRDVADLLELDIAAVQRQASPTAYILRCVKKYGNLSLELLAGVLESLGQDEAQRLVTSAFGQ